MLRDGPSPDEAGPGRRRPSAKRPWAAVEEGVPEPAGAQAAEGAPSTPSQSSRLPPAEARFQSGSKRRGQATPEADAGGGTPPSAPPPHVQGGERVPYRIVIPTRGRWRAAQLLTNERTMLNEKMPFILLKTLGFLKRHQIEPSLVSLWTADEEEKRRYEEALALDPYWAAGGVEVHVGKPGIMAQRNHIVESLPEGAYIVSLDDDIGDILWKHRAGHSRALMPMPAGGLEALIFHAHGVMRSCNAFIWGLATTCSKNVLCMWTDGISTRNGEINGFFYGFINRHKKEILPAIEEATEDAERSLRYFARDKIVLRYRMYCAETRCFKNGGGLQGNFAGGHVLDSNHARKEAEIRGAARLHSMFPTQTLPPTSKRLPTLSVNFKPIGGMVIPTTTVAALKAANKLENEYKAATTVKVTRAAKRAHPGAASGDDACDGNPPEEVEVPMAEEERKDAEEEADAREPLPGQAPHPPDLGPPASSSVPGVQDESDKEEDLQVAAHAEGADENAQFEAAMAPPAGSGGAPEARTAEEEAEMIRRAIRDSMQDIAIQINGLVTDPLEEALRESRRLEELEERQRRAERDELRHAKRLSRLESGLPSQSGSDDESQPLNADHQTRSSSSSHADTFANTDNESADPRARSFSAPSSAGQASGAGSGCQAAQRPGSDRGCADAPSSLATRDACSCSTTTGDLPGLDDLVKMGFDRDQARMALKDAGGDTGTAAVMLMSAATC